MSHMSTLSPFLHNVLFNYVQEWSNLANPVSERIEPQLFGGSHDPVAGDFRTSVLSDPDRIDSNKFFEHFEDFSASQVDQISVFVQLLVGEVAVPVAHDDGSLLSDKDSLA